MGNLLLVFWALLLVALNGFFVAAEFGLVKLRQTRVKSIAKLYGMRGRVLAKVHGRLDAYLSACQLGITLASLGLGWIGEPAFAGLLEPFLSLIGVSSPHLIHGIAFFCAFFAISFLHIVIGELAPKSLAIRVPEKMAIWTAVPLYGFYWAMYPAIWMLNASANAVLRVTGLTAAGGHDAAYTSDELKLILKSGRLSNKFTRDEWSVLAHTLEFSELDVGDLMRPFKEAITLSSEHTLAENLDVIGRHRFSRYPYLDAEGQVEGVIHLKDIFFTQHRGDTITDLGTLVRPVQVVSPSLPALELFRRFRQGAPHFAVVSYAGGAPLGFITLDNMLGALVGEIRDEFLQAQHAWTRMDDGTLIGKGSLPIFSLERAIGVDIEDDDHVDSVGGMIMEKLGNLPKEGDRIGFGRFDIVVKKMSGPRIVLVRVYPHDREAAAMQEEQ